MNPLNPTPSEMSLSNEWFHAKHDCLLPRFVSDYTKNPAQLLALPNARKHVKAVVQTVFDGVHWWCNGQLWTQKDNSKELAGLLDSRILVNTKAESQALRNMLRDDIDCIVLDEWFEDTPTSNAMEHCVEQLLARIAHCQNNLRVDFREHRSILSAWKWRNLRRIGKVWPFELRSTHQWMQSLDDRPWQEARMAYDLREKAGAVLDIRAAYASAIQSMPFPKPGVAWQELRAGQRNPHALHCVLWEPNDAVGRFYHPFWYSVKSVRAQPGYGLSDRVHCWVLDEDLPWLQRHGTVQGVYQSVVPAAMHQHPLADSVKAWRLLLEEETNAGYRALHKTRLVSSHSWTWQPQETMLVADVHALSVHALEEYSSRVGGRVGGMRFNEDLELGSVAQGYKALDSGWYTPVAWIRMKLRSHLMRRVEHAVAHGLDIAYVNIDGMHVRASNQEAIGACHSEFVDTLAPWWVWRVDKTFSKGIWFRPGCYALQGEDGQWSPTNLAPVITGRDWNLWCQARGTLDTRRLVGYWRRPNKPLSWQQYPTIALNAQRQFRSIVRRELQR